MAKVLATISGTALTPGVSRNKRYYSPEAIARAVEKAQAQLAGGTLPLTMRSHHGAEDDTSRIVGAIRSVTLAPDGSARFTAEIADTPHGRTIASLLDTSDGAEPFLRGVSIRGEWDGQVRTIRSASGPLEAGDSLTLYGLDYTASPGVAGAQVDSFTWARPGTAESTSRALITESVQQARVTVLREGVTSVAGRRKTLEERVAEEVDRQIAALSPEGRRRLAENALTAAQVPQAPARAAADPHAGADGDLYSGLGRGRRSPFWRLPPSEAPAAAAADLAGVPGVATPEQMAAMSMDEFRDYLGQVQQADAERRGLSSPIWQDGGLNSPARRR
jgi:hypothetical protein